MKNLVENQNMFSLAVVSTMFMHISSIVLVWLMVRAWRVSGYVMSNYSTSNIAFVANPGNAATKGLVINSNGTSIVVIYSGVNKAFLSLNSGTNWTSLAPAMTTTTQLVGGSMSSTGQYIYLSGYASNSSARVHISTDYGSSWSLSSYAPTVSSFPYSINTDETGQYVVLSTDEKRILLSSDYGATFTSIYTGSNGVGVGDVVVTTNGYIYFCDTENIYRGTISSLTFTAKKGLNNLCQTLTVSSDGAYVYSSDGWSLFSSFNYGDTWSSLDGVTSKGVYYPFVSIASSSSDGSVVAMMTTYYPAVSTDFGNTWAVIDPDEAYYFDAIRVTGPGSKVFLVTQSQATQDGLYVIAAGATSIVPSPTASPSPSPTTASKSDGNSGVASAGVIAGAVIGSVAGLALVCFSLYVIYWKFFAPYSSVTSDTDGISLQPKV